MKKFFIISAILAVLGLTSCEKETSKAIVGTWEAVSVEMSIEGIKMEVDLTQLDVSMTFLFKADGTGSSTESTAGVSSSVDFEYSVSGSVLSITMEGETADIPITIDGKNMSMTMDGEILDEPGTSVKINFVKK